MVRLRTIVSLSLIGGLLASPAYGDKASQAARARKQAETELANYAKCVAKAHPQRVNAYLRMAPDSPGIGKASNALSDGECLSTGVGQFKIPANLMRWSLYGALYGAEFRDAKPGELATLPPLDFVAERDAMAADALQQHVYLRDFGDCVARKQTGVAHDLLLADIYSPKEHETLGALQPFLGDCLYGKGMKLTFNRTSLRGILAEAMYKLRRGGAQAMGAK